MAMRTATPTDSTNPVEPTGSANDASLSARLAQVTEQRTGTPRGLVRNAAPFSRFPPLPALARFLLVIN